MGRRSFSGLATKIYFSMGAAPACDGSTCQPSKKQQRDERAVRVPSMIEYDRLATRRLQSSAPKHDNDQHNYDRCGRVCHGAGAYAFAKTREFDTHRHRVTHAVRASTGWSQAPHFIGVGPNGYWRTTSSGCWTDEGQGRIHDYNDGG